MLEQNFEEVVSFDFSLNEGSYSLTKEVNEDKDIYPQYLTIKMLVFQLKTYAQGLAVFNC